MNWPIRNQILVPFATVLVVSVTATTLVSVWLASRRIERQTVAELNRVIDTLAPPERSRFPFSRNVLETMRGLSGAEFVVFGENGQRRAMTLDGEVDAAALAEMPSVGSRIDSLAGRPTIEVAGTRFHVAPLTVPDAGGQPVTLAVLYPERALDRARRDAILPSLVSGGVLLLATVLLAAWLANRTTRRLGEVRHRVARIADGQFQPIRLDGPDDEIRELSRSVNLVAERLRELQATMVRTERARLLGQLAGGLAHQLRNAATGARLAVQLHLKRHGDAENREGLDVALRQLELVEEQVKSLLSLGREDRTGTVARTVAEIADDVAQLVKAACEHEHVAFELHVDEATAAVSVNDAEGVRSAVLNLVLNAVEAAGPDGSVELAATESDGRIRFEVIDDGAGPPAEFGETLFEPFVTGKQEGVGLGLALVARVAERLGGRVDWEREDGRTRFRLEVPAAESEAPRLVERRSQSLPLATSESMGGASGSTGLK